MFRYLLAFLAAAIFSLANLASPPTPPPPPSEDWPEYIDQFEVSVVYRQFWSWVRSFQSTASDNVFRDLQHIGVGRETILLSRPITLQTYVPTFSGYTQVVVETLCVEGEEPNALDCGLRFTAAGGHSGDLLEFAKRNFDPYEIVEKLKQEGITPDQLQSEWSVFSVIGLPSPLPDYEDKLRRAQFDEMKCPQLRSATVEFLNLAEELSSIEPEPMQTHPPVWIDVVFASPGPDGLAVPIALTGHDGTTLYTKAQRFLSQIDGCINRYIREGAAE